MGKRLDATMQMRRLCCVVRPRKAWRDSRVSPTMKRYPRHRFLTRRYDSGSFAQRGESRWSADPVSAPPTAGRSPGRADRCYAVKLPPLVEELPDDDPVGASSLTRSADSWALDLTSSAA
jgi:hypothetical protein